ncbi:MAG: nuclear transport factor 2 family protein [Candidatus Eiseniibacteriota bacterium]|jgi:ketosteroid isomerase-like protein
MSREDEVRTASAQFYAALNAMAGGDASSMGDIWSHAETVTAMHPIGGREVGWEAVRTSFEQVARLGSGGAIELRDQMLQVDGEVAYELGVEAGQFTMSGERVTIEHRVTNIYRRESGVWKIVHHHTDTSPAMLEVLDRQS